MAEKRHRENFAYSNSDEIPADATEACTSRNGTTRDIGRRATALGELDAQQVEARIATPEDLAETLRRMEVKFDSAFSWSPELVEELRNRILGSVEEPSEDLRRELQELFLASTGADLNDAAREIIMWFTRENHQWPVADIQRALEEKNPARANDRYHASRRVVTVLTQLSTAYEQ